MLAARFGGDETGAAHREELRRALRHMEEPRMLAETVTQWRQEALDEGRGQGRRQGMFEGERALLRRIAASLWRKMEALRGWGLPEFLRTHPSPGNRAQALAALVPAMRPLMPAIPPRPFPIEVLPQSGQRQRRASP